LSARISATACSATACGEYAGTRTTAMPSRSAAARSTWLKPAERSAIRRVPPSASRCSTAASTVSLTNGQTTS
jgi:hypothetical protein